MALGIIFLLFIVIILAMSLPAVNQYYVKFVHKIGYWSIGLIALIYILLDLWMLSIRYKDTSYWITIILINLT